MEARALKRYIRSSPRKMRLVVDMIRGKNAAQAFGILSFATQHGAVEVERLLRSAISNLSNYEDGKRFDPAEVYVKEVYVNAGPTMKRISPAPMGRAYRIRKRSNHLTIVVATTEK
jgi:large subunit ribosomal protein L22